MFVNTSPGKMAEGAAVWSKMFVNTSTGKMFVNTSTGKMFVNTSTGKMFFCEYQYWEDVCEY